MSDATAAAQAPEPSPSAVGRIVGVIVSPEETFASIARRPTWLAPMLLWVALSMVVSFFLLPKIDWDRMIRAQIEKSGRTVPEERLQTMIEQRKKFGGAFSYGIGVVSPIVVGLVVAVVIWGSFKAFGWDTSFKQAFGVTTHGFVPGMLKAVILAFLITRQESVDPQ
ncbi:MAG: YIP1 family protein, partial [Thermoanaerobaculia bacterium]